MQLEAELQNQPIRNSSLAVFNYAFFTSFNAPLGPKATSARENPLRNS